MCCGLQSLSGNNIHRYVKKVKIAKAEANLYSTKNIVIEK